MPSKACSEWVRGYMSGHVRSRACTKEATCKTSPPHTTAQTGPHVSLRHVPSSPRRWSFFFFQAEDGIRDLTVTGVQTCALPISRADAVPAVGGGAHSGGARGTSLVRERRRAGLPHPRPPDAHAVGGRGAAHRAIQRDRKSVV